jgi:hypothetical protein
VGLAGGIELGGAVIEAALRCGLQAATEDININERQARDFMPDWSDLFALKSHPISGAGILPGLVEIL